MYNFIVPDLSITSIHEPSTDIAQ